MHPRDALMLTASTDTVPQNFVTGYVFTTDNGDPFDLGRNEVVDWLAQRAPARPEMRHHVVRVPFDLATPVLWPDNEMSFASHVTVHDLTTWAEVRQLTSALVQTKLDPDRPLWEIHVAIDVDGVLGLTVPAVVVLVKVHHSTVDGLGSIQIADALFAADPPGPVPRVDAGKKPSKITLFAKGLITAPGAFAAFLWSLRHVMGNRRAAAAEVAGGRVVAQKFDRSVVSFLGRPGQRRVLNVVPMFVRDMKAVRVAVGDVKMNDLVMTVVSMGLSRYMAEKNITPEHSLGASMPIATRHLPPVETSNNQFIPSIVSLHTDVTDPIERLRRIHDSTLESITAATSSGSMATGALFTRAPGWLLAGVYRAVVMLQRPNLPYPVHTGITTVVRDASKWRIGNAHASASFGGICLESVLGISHSIDSVGEFTTISITSDPDLFDDADRYAELLTSCWEELQRAAQGDAVKSS